MSNIILFPKKHSVSIPIAKLIPINEKSPAEEILKRLREMKLEREKNDL